MLQVGERALDLAHGVADAAGDFLRDAAGEAAALADDFSRGPDDLADEARNVFAQVVGECLERGGEAPPEAEVARAPPPVIFVRLDVLAEQDNVGVGRLQIELQAAGAERTFDPVARAVRQIAFGYAVKSHASVARPRVDGRGGIRRDLNADASAAGDVPRALGGQ